MLKRTLPHALPIREIMHTPFRLRVVSLAPILSNDVAEHRTEDIVRERFDCDVLVEKDVVGGAEVEGARACGAEQKRARESGWGRWCIGRDS
jgi:hypothetical protein